MRYQRSENETWVLALLAIVYLPMVAAKTGRYPIAQIINQFTANEQPKVALGFAALVDMNILVMDGDEICITNGTEAFYQGLGGLASLSTEEVQDVLKTSSGFVSTLAAINNDSRLSPPPENPPLASPNEKSPYNQSAIPEAPPIGVGQKIFFGIFVVLVLMGILKVIFRN